MFKKIVGLWFSAKWKNAKDVEKYIKNLVANGANDFFTGYNPPYWYERFGFEISPNGRFAEHEQITDFETLKKVVEEVHTHNLEVFINLNAWYYSDETMPFIEKMISEIEEVWVDGIICWNIGILEYLKEKNYRWKINISTILAVYNSEAIRFFIENYKVNKIILSRELTLKEIHDILKDFPDLQFEVFWEGDFCRYNNGLCFAEHKYSSRDICTVVVNDLLIKKKFHPDFKKIILDDTKNNSDKIKYLSDEYESPFIHIERLLEEISLEIWDINTQEKEISKILIKNANRIDLFFDPLKKQNEEHNKNVSTFLRGLSFINSRKDSISLKDDEKKILINLEEELKTSLKTALNYRIESIKDRWGEAKLKAFLKKNFYAKGDILNLYTYLFFSQFPNLETVKFPTRGRSYEEKLTLIEKTLESWSVDEALLDRDISPERTHYDLSYIFSDRLRFRKMLKKIWHK